MLNEIERLLYSRVEAAQALGVCKATLDTLIRDEKIKPQRIGNRVLITKDELRRFVGIARRNHSE